MQPASIINRGRGPEIEGTRITVYRVMDFLSMGWHRDLIAVTLRLSSRQVQAAIDYIEANKAAVTAGYERILNRSTENSPEIEAKRRKSRAKLKAFMNQARRRKVKETARGRNPRG